jgi:biotin carboxylase
VRTRREAWDAAGWVGFPLIVKPVAGAGAADTHRVDEPRQLEAVLDRMSGVAEATCEEFIAGDEYTYETLCIDGRPVLESSCLYLPNALDARRNEWISPIIISVRDLGRADVRPGVELGRKVLEALGMGTGCTHMEWYRRPNGEAVFGEVACRPPGANMVDLMNYTLDVDLFREWARVACHGQYGASTERPYNAAIVFKRAKGEGRITGYSGLDQFLARYSSHVARLDLLPVGAPRRDWQQTFLSDGNIVVRHPDWDVALAMAREAAATVAVWAGG